MFKPNDKKIEDSDNNEDEEKDLAPSVKNEDDYDIEN